MKILLILTSHGQLGDTGKKTGFWLEELAAPYYVFKDAGAELVLASPLGGQPPLDPKSDEPDAQTQDTRRFRADQEAMQALSATKKLSSVRADDFDAVFYPGGHGPLWDLAESQDSRSLIEAMLAAGKPVAAVCHAPGVLRHVKAPDGTPLVKGKRVTGFTNTEEAAVGLTEVVPFLVEDMLKSAGGHYSKGADWQSHVVTDRLLVTGQNPASSAAGAKALLQALEANATSQDAAGRLAAGAATQQRPRFQHDASPSTRGASGQCHVGAAAYAAARRGAVNSGSTRGSTHHAYHRPHEPRVPPPDDRYRHRRACRGDPDRQRRAA